MNIKSQGTHFRAENDFKIWPRKAILYYTQAQGKIIHNTNKAFNEWTIQRLMSTPQKCLHQQNLHTKQEYRFTSDSCQCHPSCHTEVHEQNITESNDPCMLLNTTFKKLTTRHMFLLLFLYHKIFCSNVFIIVDILKWCSALKWAPWDLMFNYFSHFRN